MRAATCLLTCVLLAAVGCGARKSGGSSDPGVSLGGDDGGTSSRTCIDHDGDGYGQYCEAGKDCNDDDPTITDQCWRCAAAGQDCPCTPGTKPAKCKPPNIIGDGGTFTCSEGTRYCRDGFWSSCEIIGQYVFVKN